MTSEQESVTVTLWNCSSSFIEAIERLKLRHDFSVINFVQRTVQAESMVDLTTVAKRRLNGHGKWVRVSLYWLFRWKGANVNTALLFGVSMELSPWAI